jgi:hypothetical protein
MATKREQELLAKVDELENVNNILAFDLEWERLSSQKRLAYFVHANRKNGKNNGKTQPGKVRGLKTSQENRGKIPTDAFGARQGSQGFGINSYIISLIEKSKFDKINATTISQMSGGIYSKGRVQAHLNWMKKKGLI